MSKEIYERSIAYGDSVANSILGWSALDNYKQSRSFPKFYIQDSPGAWKPTPPAYMDAVEPHWNTIRPMTLDSSSQCIPDPPTSFSSSENSKFYQEAYEVYGIGRTLTHQQRSIASFWDCNPFMMNVKGHIMYATKKISPGGHWMNVAQHSVQNQEDEFCGND